MERWLALARGISRFNERVGWLVCWGTFFMVLVGAYNAFARYLTRYTDWTLTSNALLELQWYLFSLVFLLGAAYTLYHNGHVRVDVFYSRLSPRGKAWVNLLGTLFFLIPFSVTMLWVSLPAVWNSWAIGEMSPDPGGLPRYPVKTLVPVAFLLIILQGVADAIRAYAFLRGYLSVYLEEKPPEAV